MLKLCVFIPDPLEHPPNDTEVGADLRAKNQQKIEKKENKRNTLCLIFLFGVTLLGVMSTFGLVLHYNNRYLLVGTIPVWHKFTGNLCH